MIRYLDLSRCSPEVQLAARCIGLNYKRPYNRYGKAYYRPWQNRFVTSEDADVYTYWLGMEIKQGWIYQDELEDLMAMHECYHNKLAGNGYLDELMKKVKSLDVRGVGV